MFGIINGAVLSLGRGRGDRQRKGAKDFAAAPQTLGQREQIQQPLTRARVAFLDQVADHVLGDDALERAEGMFHGTISLMNRGARAATGHLSQSPRSILTGNPASNRSLLSSAFFARN